METTLERAGTEATVATQRPRIPISLPKLVAFVLLAALSILFIVPFLWMISTSLTDVRNLSDKQWIPNPVVVNNFTDAFSYGYWGEWATNTVIITAFSVLGNVLSTALVAYAFARLRWPGRDKVFGLVLATMMLPGVVTLIPSFILFSKLPAFGFMGSKNWIDTFLPLTVPAFTGNAFYIFLARQFMRGIPMELSEAAKIDGASELRTWWSIILPLTKPVMAAISIFSFQGAWEDFQGPLLFLRNEHHYTLQLGLRGFEAAAGGAPHFPQLMAASLVIITPMIIVFVLFQRYFVEGVTLTGMGGR